MLYSALRDDYYP